MAIFYFKPVKGLMEWTNKRDLYDFLLENEGKECYANIGKIKGVRSLPQNSFYWLYLEIISKETGNNVDDLHRLFKGLFLPKKTVVFKGKEYLMSGSTTELSKGDMSMYMDRICAETSIPIPDRQTASIAYPVSDSSNTPTF